MVLKLKVRKLQSHLWKFRARANSQYTFRGLLSMGCGNDKGRYPLYFWKHKKGQYPKVLPFFLTLRERRDYTIAAPTITVVEYLQPVGLSDPELL